MLRRVLRGAVRAVPFGLFALMTTLSGPAGAAGQPTPWQMNLQAPATSVMEGIWDFWVTVLIIFTVISLQFHLQF